MNGETKKINVPFDIPTTWEWVRLCSLGQVIGGGTPSTEIKAYWDKGTISWITPADMGEHRTKYISFTQRKISELGLSQSSATLMPPNSIVLSSRAPIGYLGITKIPLCTNQGCKSVVPYLQESVEYLYYAIMMAIPNIKERASGTTFKEISGKGFGQTLIPLPPLCEQNRIADLLIQTENKFTIIQSSYNDISRRIEILKYKILDSFFGEDSRYKSYYGKRTETTLEKLIPNEKIGDGDWVLSEDMNPNGDIQLLQLKHIGNMVYQNKSFCHIDENFFKEHNCSEIKENYLLINRLVASSMACCLMPQTNTKTITSVDVCWIAPDETYNSKYIMYYLSSKNFQNKVLMLCSGSTRKRISKKNLTRIPLLIHDRMQQDIIVNRIENLFELVEKVIG